MLQQVPLEADLRTAQKDMKHLYRDISGISAESDDARHYYGQLLLNTREKVRLSQSMRQVFTVQVNSGFEQSYLYFQQKERPKIEKSSDTYRTWLQSWKQTLFGRFGNDVGLTGLQGAINQFLQLQAYAEMVLVVEYLHMLRKVQM